MAHQLARSEKSAADCLIRLTHGTRVHRTRHENYIPPNPKPAALPKLLRDGRHRSADGLPADPGQPWRARIGSAGMEPSRVGRSPHVDFLCLHHACGGASRNQLGVAHQVRCQGSRMASWSRTARRSSDYRHFPFAADYPASGRNRQKARDILPCLTSKRIRSDIVGIKRKCEFFRGTSIQSLKNLVSPATDPRSKRRDFMPISAAISSALTAKGRWFFLATAARAALWPLFPV
jgi:hypothetical protein